MVLIDTSAWIEYLRDSNSPTCNEVEGILGLEPAICDAVRMEIFAGARDEQQVSELKRLIARARIIPTDAIDYENAASIYRACRRLGITVRTHIDCLIAAVAIRANTPLLHKDSDFDAIARILSDMARIAEGAPLPALGEGKACEYCAARGLCRKDFWS